MYTTNAQIAAKNAAPATVEAIMRGTVMTSVLRLYVVEASKLPLVYNSWHSMTVDLSILLSPGGALRQASILLIYYFMCCRVSRLSSCGRIRETAVWYILSAHVR